MTPVCVQQPVAGWRWGLDVWLAADVPHKDLQVPTCHLLHELPNGVQHVFRGFDDCLVFHFFGRTSAEAMDVSAGLIDTSAGFQRH